MAGAFSCPDIAMTPIVLDKLRACAAKTFAPERAATPRAPSTTGDRAPASRPGQPSAPRSFG